MKTLLIPTQLFIGSNDILEEKTELLLQSHFCINNKQNSDKQSFDLTGCYCNQCRKIKNKQHENIIFVSPEKYYTVKEIEIIFENIGLSLDNNEKFFFVLEKAETLNLATANRLLKILEEPPSGYNFILQANNINNILPTIKSRCHIKNFLQDKEITRKHPISSFFYEQNLNNPIEFDKTLKENLITDNESIELLNQMIIFYGQKIKRYYQNNKNMFFEGEHQFNLEVFNFLTEKLKTPPQSGSSKLFWKNIYISFPRKELLSLSKGND